jgi:hypothetical protein
MNRDVAVELIQKSEDIIASLSRLLNYSIDHVDDKQSQHQIKRAVGMCIAQVGVEICGIAYKEFPDLKPEWLKSPKD